MHKKNCVTEDKRIFCDNIGNIYVIKNDTADKNSKIEQIKIPKTCEATHQHKTSVDGEELAHSGFLDGWMIKYFKK